MNLTDNDKKILKQSFNTFLSGADGKFIVFDLETNGFVGSDVLSIGAQKCQIMRGAKIKVIDHYDRYYYPIGKYNWSAIRVNKLTEKAIKQKRKNNDYPDHFKDDISSFKKWTEDIICFVGHNVSFDMSFFPKPDFVFPRVFDTMRVNEKICKLPGANGYKFPKLIEAAQFYEIVPEGEFHTSFFDVDITRQVFEAMYTWANTN